MLGIFVAVGFIGMVLAPCAVAIYSKLGSKAESQEAGTPETLATVFEQAAAPPAELIRGSEAVVRRPVPLSTSPLAAAARAPKPVPTLREVAELAAREAKRAQAVAAQALVDALQEASREASKRAAAAGRLAEAAERELMRASQASLQAEALKAQAKAAQQGAEERDYLPQNHPSLDFPRSRVAPRKVA